MGIQEQVRILEQAEQRYSGGNWPFYQYIVICGLKLSAGEAFNNDTASMSALSDILSMAEASYLNSLIMFAERLGVATHHAKEAVAAYTLSYAHRIRGEILQKYPHLAMEAAVTRTDLEEICIEGIVRTTPEKAGLFAGLINAYIAGRERSH